MTSSQPLHFVAECSSLLPLCFSSDNFGSDSTVTGVALSRLFVQRDLGTPEEEDVEAKAFQRLGEGAGAEEEGELCFWLLDCFWEVRKV